MIRDLPLCTPLAAAFLAVALAACSDPASPAAPAPTATAPAAAPAEPGPAADVAEIVVDYPLPNTIFPPDFTSPTFLWHDATAAATSWNVEVAFGDGAEPLRVVVPGDPPPVYPADPRAFGPTNEVYEGTEYQRSAKSWTPAHDVWQQMKRRSVEQPMTITFTGIAETEPHAALSRGSVVITTSKDPVGAPFFYRDVPLTPSVGEDGRIKPLSEKAVPLIGWRLRDVSLPHSKLVLTGMSSCGNCHSFSLDGKTLGMDVDGPSGDKGMYAIKPISKETVIDYDDVITWNSFEGKPEGHKTIGFLSRVSPDGAAVVSTVNEELYINNFANYRFLQVFYPTRGILAVYDRAADTIRALPGADDPEYVHAGAVWTPDGKDLVFMRAKARPAFVGGMARPRYPNDPNELPLRYDLYRIPYDGGRGGEAVPVPGASGNGMSNTFAKISPDGKWLVWVKCKNGLLLRPDSRLWIMPLDGSAPPRRMTCNMELMNSWHSFSPNSRWMVFTSKNNRPYTQAFLTHIDEDGNDSPAILVPNCTASNRAVNLPEFLNAPYEALDSIDVPAIAHHTHYLAGLDLVKTERFDEAVAELEQALDADPEFARAHGALGYVYNTTHRIDEAIAYFRRAVELDPLEYVQRMNLAIVYRDNGHPAAALAVYRGVLESAPWLGAAKAAIDGIEEKLPEHEARVAELQAKAAETPGDAALQRDLAHALDGLGRTAEAIPHLARAVELAPDDADTMTELAWTLATNPDPAVRDGERARRLAERAVELTGGARMRPLDALAAAQAESGRFDEAVEAAERALACGENVAWITTDDIRRRLALYRERMPFRSL